VTAPVEQVAAADTADETPAPIAALDPPGLDLAAVLGGDPGEGGMAADPLQLLATLAQRLGQEEEQDLAGGFGAAALRLVAAAREAEEDPGGPAPAEFAELLPSVGELVAALRQAGDTTEAIL
jgi:hypothetical protein